MSLVAEVTSLSRLNKYETCSEQYKREYILKVKTPRMEADYFLLGTMCHASIEEYYYGRATSPLDALDGQWAAWMTEKGLDLQVLLPRLMSIAGDVQNLRVRAGATYVGADAIRKAGPHKKGSPDYWRNPVADAPHMTGDWKKALEALNLDSRQLGIDIECRQSLGEAFRSVSVSSVYADSRSMLTGYTDPAVLASVEYIEFPLSNREFEHGVLKDIANPVKLPNGLYLNGYIDLVGRTHAGGIVLLDHKTSVKEKSMLEIAHDEQLLMYAWAWHELFGEWPTHIGINHLPSGRCTVAPVDPEMARAVIERRCAVVAAIKAGVFTKRDPFAYNSPCIKMNYDGTVKEFCAHLDACHPLVAKGLRASLGQSSDLDEEDGSTGSLSPTLGTKHLPDGLPF